MWHDSIMYDMTQLYIYMLCALILRLPRAPQSRPMCDMTHSYMSHIICWTQLISMRDMTHQSVRSDLKIAPRPANKSYV